RDDNAAVRAAAASALARLGSPRAIPALSRLRRDSSEAVRNQAVRSIELLSASGGASAPVAADALAAPLNWARVRAALVVGEMRNRSAYRAGRGLERHFRDQVATNLGRLTRVAVFADAIPSATKQQLSRRRLPVLRLDGSLTEVRPEQRDAQLAVRCEVSLMLFEEGSRDIRGMLRGAATGTGGGGHDRARREQQLAEQALSAAVRSALSTVDVAIARAARRRGDVSTPAQRPTVITSPRDIAQPFAAAAPGRVLSQRDRK